MKTATALLLTFSVALAAPVQGVALAETVETADPRADDPAYQRAQRLFGAIRDILEDAAQARADARDAEGVGTYMKRQLGLDAKSRAERLLSDAFSVVSDAPVTEIQREIANRREAISELKDAISRLREDRISAPVEGGVTNTLGLSRTRADIDAEIDGATARIAGNEIAIREAKARFREEMARAGAEISPEETDLLIDSVTGDDIVKIASAYQAARGVSKQLMDLMDASGEDLARAKRYYAMHTALLALLVHAQGTFIDKVNGEYLPKLSAIEGDILAARRETERLLGEQNTQAQHDALVGNLNSQDIALEAAGFYRQHLENQRAEIIEARRKAVKELRIADNTLRTVDASFQLRAMMESATLSFEALQGMESPGIERIFRNEQLRREFQELSEKLAPGS